MGFDPAQFQKKDTVESSLSELEKQSTDLISYFDSFFSSNFDKDTTIIREDGVVEVLSSQNINTLDNPEGTNYYFQSSAERLQQIGEDIKQELEEVTFDTKQVGNQIQNLLKATIRDEVGYGDRADLDTILNKNSENFENIINNQDTYDVSLDEFFNNKAQTDIMAYILSPSSVGATDLSVDVDVPSIKRYIDDGDNYINASVDDKAETYYYINEQKLDTFSRDTNGYLNYSDSAWTGSGLLDYNDPENFALAMFSIFTNEITNNSSHDGTDYTFGTKVDTLDDAVSSLDKKIEDYIELHKKWYDTIPRKGEPDAAAGLYPPAFQLFYMNGAGEVDESKGVLGAFSLADENVTSLAELISFSPDTPDVVRVETILNNWDTATTAEKLPIMKFFAHSELYSAVQGGMNSDSGINHPNSVIHKFTSDNRKSNPFIDYVSTGSYADDNYQEEKFPLLQDFLAWERNGTVITDDSGYRFTGTQKLGDAFTTGVPNQFQQLLDLYLQHVEKNVPRYVEDNRTVLDLFASNSELPGQDGLNVETAIYKDIATKSYDTISVTQNNLNRGISKARDPVLIDMLNQTVVRMQEFPDYTEADKTNVINGFDPVKNDFVAGFPTLDIRDYDQYFKILLNDTILTLNPLLLAEGQNTIDTLDDIGPGDTIANLYAGSSTASKFTNIGSEENLAKVLDRYEKLRKIIKNIEKPVDSLDNDQAIVTRPSEYDGLTNLDNPSAGLIKKMLDGGYVGAAGTTLPGDHLDQLDYIVDVFASQVEFGQPKSYANIYGSQVLESGNINARQFTKKLAEPRTDGSVPEDTSVPAPLLYASSTSLVIGVIGKELINRVDDMNLQNNIPSYEISRDSDGKLITTQGFSGSSEGQQFLKNLLDIANSDTIEVSFNSTSVSDDVIARVNAFKISDPYKNIKISYADPDIMDGLKDLYNYLKDSPGGSDENVYSKLDNLFSSSNSIVQEFISTGYIGTKVIENVNLTDTDLVAVKELVTYGTIANNSYDQLREKFDNKFYFNNTMLKGSELYEIKDFIDHYQNTFWEKFNPDKDDTFSSDIYKKFYMKFYNENEPDDEDIDPRNDPLKRAFDSDLDLINSIISKTGATDDDSNYVDFNVKDDFIYAETALLNRFAGNASVLDNLQIADINNRIDEFIDDLNASNYNLDDNGDPIRLSETFGNSIKDDKQRKDLIAMFEAMKKKNLNANNLKNNYPPPKVSLSMTDLAVDASFYAKGFSMQEYQNQLDTLKNNMQENDTAINRKKYLRMTQHFQELFIMLSGAIVDSGNKYGIDISQDAKYGEDSKKTLADQLVDIEIKDEDENVKNQIQETFRQNLNLDENINALQASFDSQLTQRKDSATADYIATNHFFKQAQTQTESSDFIDDLSQLFVKRKIKQDSTVKDFVQNPSNDVDTGTYKYAGYATNHNLLLTNDALKIKKNFPDLTVPNLPANFKDLATVKTYLLGLSELRDEMYRNADTDEKRDTLDKFEKWLGNNSISRIMIGGLKDSSGVESDLNLIDRMMEYKEKSLVRNPGLTNEVVIYNNFRDEMQADLGLVSAQEENLQNLSLDIDNFLNELDTQPIDAAMLDAKFQSLVRASQAEPVSGGAYRIAGDIKANLRVAEEVILPKLQAAEAANNTGQIEYYNLLLGHLLENKPLPDKGELNGLITAADANSVIKPEDLVMTRADYEALGTPLVIDPGLPDIDKRDQFRPPIAEPFRTQLEVAKVLMTEMSDKNKDILNNPDKINTELLYKSMISGLFQGAGVNAVNLNSVANAAATEMGGHDKIFKPVDVYDAVAAAETDPAYQVSGFGSFNTIISKSKKVYLTEGDVPDLEDSYLQNNSLSRAVKNERRRIDNNINPRNSELKELADMSISYSPTYALSDIAEDISTEYKKDSISGKTIQELLLLLYVFQMFERSSWDFNKYVNDPNRYSA